MTIQYFGKPPVLDVNRMLEDAARIDNETRRSKQKHVSQTRPVSRGSVKGGKRGTICYFDEETFEQIRARAEKERTSFGEQVRLLVEWGLEDAADALLR